MRPVSIHTAWWRYPGSEPDSNFNFQHLKRFAQTLERGLFDAFFMANHVAVLNMPLDANRGRLARLISAPGADLSWTGPGRKIAFGYIVIEIGSD
jgi:alkanesulfonate monooxygenase SsuD/methylene tetrahydromethanopterin reductase-like flavin-dependent oxidoreductase (luciferase family)